MEGVTLLHAMRKSLLSVLTLFIGSHVFAGEQLQKGTEMKTTLNKGYDYSEFKKVVRALNVARLQKGLSRKEASDLLGWKARSIEQIERFAFCNWV